MTPPAVFVSDRVLQDDECMNRLRAFARATNAPEWEVVRDEEIPAMLERSAWVSARMRLLRFDRLHGRRVEYG